MQIMDKSLYAITIIYIVVVGGLGAGLLKLVYTPAVRFSTHKVRTIQSSSQNAQLHIMACVHVAENVPSLVSLFEVSHNGSLGSPVCIYLLHLVPLVGHSTSTLVPYVNKKRRRRQSLFLSRTSYSSLSHNIVNAFCSLKQTLKSLSIVPFVGMSPYATMHEDVCILAAEKRVVLVILPFHKHFASGIEHCNPNIQSMNVKALHFAPCSVAILVDRGAMVEPACSVGYSCSIAPRVTVIFLGGGDDREALSYGARMANNPALQLTVIRILPSEEVLKERGQDEEEDEEAIEEFKEIVDDRRVIYREETVSDGIATVEVLKKVCEDCELLIVGRREGKESVLTAGLEEWSEYPELGVIGDTMAVAEFGAKLSTLVVQQQVRDGKSTIQGSDRDHNSDEEDLSIFGQRW